MTTVIEVVAPRPMHAPPDPEVCWNRAGRPSTVVGVPGWLSMLHVGKPLLHHSTRRAPSWRLSSGVPQVKEFPDTLQGSRSGSLLTAATMSVKLLWSLAAVRYQPAGELKEIPPQLRRTVAGELLIGISAPEAGPLVEHAPGASVGYAPLHPATGATPTSSATARDRRTW